jgi:spermidine synthase
MQSGSPLTQPREWLATVSVFRRTFRIMRPYLGWVPIYPGVLWSWVIGSDEIDPTNFDEITLRTRLDGLRERLRLYNPAVHRAAFALPTFLRSLLELELELERERDARGPLNADDLRAAGHPLPGVVG